MINGLRIVFRSCVGRLNLKLFSSQLNHPHISKPIHTNLTINNNKFLYSAHRPQHTMDSSSLIFDDLLPHDHQDFAFRSHKHNLHDKIHSSSSKLSSFHRKITARPMSQDSLLMLQALYDELQRQMGNLNANCGMGSGREQAAFTSSNAQVNYLWGEYQRMVRRIVGGSGTRRSDGHSSWRRHSGRR